MSNNENIPIGEGATTFDMLRHQLESAKKELEHYREYPEELVGAKFAKLNNLPIDDCEVISCMDSAKVCETWGTIGRRKLAKANGALCSLEGLLRCKDGTPSGLEPMTDSEVVSEMIEELPGLQEILQLVSDESDGLYDYEREYN